MYKLLITGLGIAAIAVSALACGSSEGTDSPAAEVVTRAQFVKQANAVCARVYKEVQSAGAALEESRGGKPVTLAAAMKQILGPSLKRQAEALGSLAPPEKDAPQIDRMVTVLAKEAEAMASKGPAAASGQGLEQFHRIAETLGLKTCQLI